jgi:hypothetical protein
MLSSCVRTALLLDRQWNVSELSYCWADDVMFQNCHIAGLTATCFRSLMFQNSHVDDVMNLNSYIAGWTDDVMFQNSPIAGPIMECFRTVILLDRQWNVWNVWNDWNAWNV